MPRLRFVEITADKQNIEVLENLPSQIVGHSGKVKPQITNGHISKYHATVCYQKSENGIDETWQVTDGDASTGIESKNGLRNSEGERIYYKTTLRDVGDRVNLLYIYNNNAYLEVFNTDIEKVNATSGLSEDDIKPQLSKMTVNTNLIKKDVSKVTEQVKTNLKHLGAIDTKQTEMSIKIEGLISSLAVGLEHVEDVGSKPKPYLIGFSILITASILAIFTFGVYRNINPIIRQVFKIEIDIKDVNTDNPPKN